MTPTKPTRNGSVRLALLVLTTSAIVGGSIYGLTASHIDDRIITVTAEIRVLRADLARETERMNRSEASMAEVRDRLARIETKLDALLDRTSSLESAR